MSGIRTAAAAELLGVSPSTLRTWERRLGYPSPRRTPGNHRQYDLSEIEALREALEQTGNISSAVDIARRRGRGPSSPARLLAALDRFDERAADRELEESLVVRSLERSVEDVLLPAIEQSGARPDAEGDSEYACRWAVGWLHSARRLAPGASRDVGVLLLDSGTAVGPERVQTLSLDLFLRRAGLRVVLLSATLPEARFTRALRALSPAAAVLCGAEAKLDALGPHLRRVIREHGDTRLLGYRAAVPPSGSNGLPSLGDRPGEAREALLGLVT